MFTVSVETNFRASHRLRLPDGSKEALHSHNWLVAAEVASERLNNMGLVIDFRNLKAIIDSVIGRFGQGPLEKIDYFLTNNASAENVAKYIYEQLAAKLPGGTELRTVTVVEAPGCSAKFSADPAGGSGRTTATA